MGKWAASDVYDAGLLVIREKSERLFLLAEEPAGYAAALNSAMGILPLGPGDISPPIDSGAGRKIRVAPRGEMTIKRSGTPTHVALGGIEEERIYFVGICDAQRVRKGDIVRLPGFDIEMSGVA